MGAIETIQNNVSKIKGAVSELQYDWDELLQGVRQPDRDEMATKIRMAIDTIEEAVNELED